MKNSELIANFLNNVVSGDAEAAKAAFSVYCNHKAKSIGQAEKITERAEQFKAKLLEFNNEEDPIRLDGDKLLVNNKVVGRVHYDMADFDSEINFIAADGTFSKGFHELEALVAFVSQRYLGEK